MNPLAFRLAWRELRHNRSFALLFLFNLALGLTGFLTLDAFKVSVASSIHDRSKGLLAADISIGGRRDLTPAEEVLVKETLPADTQSARNLEFFTMAAGARTSRLVQVKAIERSYPFYGDLVVGSGAGNPAVLEREKGGVAPAWVSPELLPQLQMKLGDRLKLGGGEFELVDTVVQDPAGSSSFLSLAPKIFIARSQVPRTGLVSTGGSIGYTRLFKIPGTTDAVAAVRTLNEKLTDPALRVQTHKGASDQVARAATYLGDYLGLATLVAFFLASVGSAYLFRSFLSRRSREVAVLRTLGLSRSAALSSYSVQLLILGTLALVPAAVFSALLLPLVTKLLQTLFPFSISATLSWRSLGLALCLSTVGSLLLCLPVLVRVRRLQPALLFQESDVALPPSARDSLWLLPAVVLYWLLSIWQAKSILVGSLFTLGLLGTTALVLGGGSLILQWLGKIQYRTLLWRLPLRQLARQKVATLSCVLALSIGTLLVNLIGQLQVLLKTQLEEPQTGKLPSFFLFDIQEEQKDPLLALLEKEKAKANHVSPMIRGRLTHLNGEAYGKGESAEGANTREEEVERRFRNRGLNLTYREKLSDSEEITEGRDISDQPGVPQVSVEKEYAKRMGFKMGDKLKLDVQGVEVEATIANFRRVQWSSFQPNFFIQFPLGVIDEAPKTFLASVGKLTADEKLSLQEKVVGAFPNVSLIDVSQVVERILAILTQMASALRFMAALALIAGSVVLFSVASHQARLRRWDIAMLKTLGARFKDVQRMSLIEFGVLGFMSSCFGIVGALGASYLFSNLVFDSRWVVEWKLPLFSLFAVTLTSAAIALLAARQALSESPQLLLRQK